MADAGDSITLVQDGNMYSKDDWGIPDEQLGFNATQSVSISNSITAVEAKNRVGEVVALVMYDKRSEVTVEGVGKPEDVDDLGDTIELSQLGDHLRADSAKIIVTEIGVELTNEDWIKYSCKGNVYQLIT